MVEIDLSSSSQAYVWMKYVIPLSVYYYGLFYCLFLHSILSLHLLQ
jgi:hypothetical protein